MAHTTAPPRQVWTAGPPRRARRVARTVGVLLVVALMGVVVALVVPPALDRAPAESSSGADDAEGAAQPIAEPSPTASPDAELPPTPPPDAVAPSTPRTVTVDEPLRVWIAGDSMWELAGPALVTILEETGLVEAHLDFHYSSGLTRPDYLDWSAYADEAVATHRPELVIFLTGANDSQPLADSGINHQPGTAGFAAVYEHRTRALMAQLAADGRHVLWVGLPVMRSDDFDQRMRFLNEIHEQAAATQERVEFLPTRHLFTDSEGRYASDLPVDATGAPVPMRGSDGIHLSAQGARHLASHLYAEAAARWGLP